MDAVLVGEGDLHLSGREGDFFEERGVWREEGDMFECRFSGRSILTPHSTLLAPRMRVGHRYGYMSHRAAEVDLHTGMDEEPVDRGVRDNHHIDTQGADVTTA